MSRTTTRYYLSRPTPSNCCRHGRWPSVTPAMRLASSLAEWLMARSASRCSASVLGPSRSWLAAPGHPRCTHAIPHHAIRRGTGDLSSARVTRWDRGTGVNDEIPRMRWIFPCFEGMSLVHFHPLHRPPLQEITGIEPLHKQVIRSLGHTARNSVNSPRETT